MLVAAVVSGTLADADPTAYTEPVGYESLIAPADSLTLLGLRLHTATEVAGFFTSVAGTQLTDTSQNFESLLDPVKTHLVELIGGALDGRVLEITAIAGHTITVDTALPAASNVEYRIRPVPHLSEIITPIEVLATDNFNPDKADLILIPSGGGKFRQYYVSSHMLHSGYFNAATGLPEDPLLWYPDAFYYLRRDTSEFMMVVTGTVKRRNTLLQVTDTFNYFSGVYPVLLTLAEADLSASLQAGTADTADIVWIQEATGKYQRYFYSNGTPPLGVGWRMIDAPPGTANEERGSALISPGFIIQRRAPQPYNALMTPPDAYAYAGL